MKMFEVRCERRRCDDQLTLGITHRSPGGKDPFGKEDHSWHPEERVTLERAIVAYASTGAYLMHAEAGAAPI